MGLRKLSKCMIMNEFEHLRRAVAKGMCKRNTGGGFFPLKYESEVVGVDRTVCRNRLFEQTFKPTNTMKRNRGIMAPVQAGIEDFKGVFQDRIRAMVRQGLLDLIAQEVRD